MTTENVNDTAGGVGLQRLVSPLSMRPASTEKRCFYCQQAIGETHNADCVLLKKKVRVRMIVEYEVDVPNHWDKAMIELHRNDGNWCADNALDELQTLAEAEGCICNKTRFEYIEDASGEFLQEG